VTINHAIAHVTVSFSIPDELARSPLIRHRGGSLLWRKCCDLFYSFVGDAVMDEHRNRSRKRRINHFFQHALNFGPNFSLRPALTVTAGERLLGSRFGWTDAFVSDLPQVDALTFSDEERMNWEMKAVFDQPGEGTPFPTDFVVDTDTAFNESEDYKMRDVIAGLFLRTRTITSAPTFLKRHCFLWFPPGRMKLKTVSPMPEALSTYVVIPVLGFTRRPDEVIFRGAFTVTVFFIPTDHSFEKKRSVSADELSRLVASVPRFPYFNQVRSEIELTGDLATFAPADLKDTTRSKDIALYDWIVNVLCRTIFQGLISNSGSTKISSSLSQHVGSTLLQSCLISRIWSVVTICDGDCWTVERMNAWGNAALSRCPPEEGLTKELIDLIQQIASYRVSAHDLSNKIFLDYFGLIKLNARTTYLAFYEPERSAFLDFCPQKGEHYPFMSLYLLAWRLPMALGLSSTNALSNLFHHEINRRKRSKRFYQNVRDLVLEFEDSYDLDILLEAFRSQYASARKLEGIERDYTHLTGESSILFQQVAADSSRRSDRHLTLLTWALVSLTAILSLESIKPFFCYLIIKIELAVPIMSFVTRVCAG
jgi:hypothetical protein